MHSMPSNELILLTRPYVTSFYGGSFFHRLKHLQKSDRRALHFGFNIWMEVCVPRNTSSYGSSTDPLSPTHYSSGDLSMNDLKACLTDFLNNKDLEISTSDINTSPGEYDTCNVEKEDEPKDSDKSKCSSATFKKCFSKCVAFPPPGEPKSSVDGLLVGEEKQDVDITAEVSEVNGCTKSVSHCYSQSVLLPTPSKLVSAMKGSREKPKKLSVTWAPDVYDPTPTSVSHVPSNKNHRHNGKKYGKNKQKGGGKSTRGSKGKEKKQQPRKNTGSSTKKFKNLHDDIGAIGFNEPQMGFLDFNVETSDPFCGSSFLKKSVTKLHFPVAEAT
ncbi:hypothetical protein BUALT_Bualt11G0117900 [Buddleja alternifolia]|uniref:Uncharacterized protein n=1 Tax=Buddleja alternifolia TaxID=168488 RepID=A0AAV6X515_9LAMI|nr:hypothetical protein BUALT_Bualt11G0117900 [Buddleja alternifolia]